MFCPLQMLAITLKRRTHMEFGGAAPGAMVVHVVYFQPSQNEDGRPRLQPKRRVSLEVLCFCRTLKLY